MADIKRINYFDGLLIKEDDFNLEQDYHIRLRRLHNRYFHKHGIIRGLDLQYNPTTKKATVTQGMALDQNTVKYADNSQEENSREIILSADASIDLSSFDAAKDTVYFYIRYNEDTTDTDQDKGGDKYIHWEEKAVIEYKNAVLTQTGYVYLGKALLSSGTIDKTGRIDAGFYGVSGETRSLTMGIEGQSSGLASINGKQINGQNGIEIKSPQTNICGTLTVTGDLKVEGTSMVLSTDTLEVKDNIITLNKDEKGAQANLNTGGIEVFRGSSQKKAQLLWDETNTQWLIGTEDTKPLAVKTPASGGTTVDVSGNLTVHGLLTASSGNAQSNGIAFTSNPGGGSGDVATIRYYNRSGENCTLEINVANDAQDHIALMTQGNVGIGTTEPQAQLQATKQVSVGPFASPNNNQGVLETCGSSAGVSFFKRTLTAYPTSFNAGDRYQWYNNGGTACLWTDSKGDLFKVDSTGNATIIGATTTASLAVSNAVTAGSLTVSGATTTASLTVSNAVTAGSLTVSGATTTASLTVSNAVTAGSLTVSGATTTASLTVSNAVTAGSLTVNGQTNIFSKSDNPLVVYSGDDNKVTFIQSRASDKKTSADLTINLSGGKVGIGTKDLTRAVFEVAGTVNHTSAIFSRSQGIALVADVPSIGLNCYYNGAWTNLGTGYCGIIDMNYSKGIMSFYTGSSASAAADSKVTPTQRMTISTTGVVAVAGELTVGINGQYKVPVTVEKLRIIRGTVYQQFDSKSNWSSYTARGSGWSMSRTAKGKYTVTFSEAFKSEPTVMPCQVYSADDANTRDNALIQSVTTTNFTIKVGDSDGDAQDRNFGFMVIGEW